MYLNYLSLYFPLDFYLLFTYNPPMLEHAAFEPPSAPRRDPKLLALEKVGDEIAELSAHLQAAEYRLLCLIREFDEGGGWFHQGAKTCAHWLSWRIGLDLGAAREKVRVAKAVANLPRLGEAMSRAEISYSKVRAVTRVATPENEEELLTIALGGTASQVEQIVRAWRKVDTAEERMKAKLQQEERSFTMVQDEDGMWMVRGRLTPDVGAVLMKALQAAGDALFKQERDVSAETSMSDRTHEQKRADALRLVAESALAGGLDPGKASDRYQVVAHIDQPVLQDPAAPGQSVLEPGVGGSAETSRRIACDASVVEITHDESGSILNLGRKRRTISPAIRRALDARDPTCRFPGCKVRFTQGHHVEHWANGGETKLTNLLNLCHHHHHCVHDGGYRVTLFPDGRAVFYRPDGRLIPEVPPQPKVPDNPIEALREKNLENGILITGEEGAPKWGYAPIDWDWAVDAPLQNLELRRKNEPPTLH